MRGGQTDQAQEPGSGDEQWKRSVPASFAISVGMPSIEEHREERENGVPDRCLSIAGSTVFLVPTFARSIAAVRQLASAPDSAGLLGRKMPLSLTRWGGYLPERK